MGFSHTPYMSLDMNHTTKITLSLSCRHNICCGLLFVSIPDWHYSFVYRSDKLPPSLSHTHTQLLLPLPFPTTFSLSHTQNSRFRTPDSYFSHKHWSTSLQIGLYTRTLVLPLSHTCLSPAPCIYVDFSSLLETRPLDRAHTHYRLILSWYLSHTHSLCLCHTCTPSSSSLPLSHTHMGFLQQLARCPCVARNIKMHLYE